MFNIFEQPWTLLTVAVFVLVVVLTIRQIFPARNQWWLLMVPIVLAVAAFGLDYLVKTDLEKIDSLVQAGLKAVENEDVRAIGVLISPDYKDSYHNSKPALMAYCRELLDNLQIKKNIRTNQKIEIARPAATVRLKVLTVFDEQQSGYMGLGSQSILSEIKLSLVKNQSGRWLVNQTEILKINNHVMNWRQISL